MSSIGASTSMSDSALILSLTCDRYVQILIPCWFVWFVLDFREWGVKGMGVDLTRSRFTVDQDGNH